MDRGDAFDVFEVMSPRAQRRVITAVVVVAIAGNLIAPGLRLPERISRWVVDGMVERIEDIVDDLFSVTVPPVTAPTRLR